MELEMSSSQRSFKFGSSPVRWLCTTDAENYKQLMIICTMVHREKFQLVIELIQNWRIIQLEERRRIC